MWTGWQPSWIACRVRSIWSATIGEAGMWRGWSMRDPSLCGPGPSTSLAAFDTDYVWHERAQVWQTPGAGEAAVAQQLAIPKPQLAAAYERLGMVSRATAEACAAAYSPEMGRCILSLYRSAAQPRMAEWGAQLAGLRSRTGLVNIQTTV